MEKRRNSMRAAALGAVLAGTIGVLSPTAGAAENIPTRTTAAAAAFAFQCQIPRNGYGNCIGDRVTVPAGHYVRVKNVSSGGKAIRFQARNVSGNHLLGTSAKANQHRTVFVWRNDTGRRITIEFRADADGRVNTICNARAYVTPR